MGKKLDLKGQKFGRLTVIEDTLKKSQSKKRWKCKCECGKIVEVISTNLTQGYTKSCGCLRIMDLTGRTFGRLYVVKIVEERNKGKIIWECLCSCGKITHVKAQCLRKGETKSCGCYQREKAQKTLLTHGLGYHPLSDIWGTMKQRCYNPKNASYTEYGGRGIQVCEEWKEDFISFYKWCIGLGWKEDLHIGRKNINEDYSPLNCHLATPRTNNLNQRLLTKSNSSGYRGISFNKRMKKWISYITVLGSRFTLGSFEEKKEALKARNWWILRNNLEHEYKIQEWKGD